MFGMVFEETDRLEFVSEQCSTWKIFEDWEFEGASEGKLYEKLKGGWVWVRLSRARSR